MIFKMMRKFLLFSTVKLQNGFSQSLSQTCPNLGFSHELAGFSIFKHLKTKFVR